MFQYWEDRGPGGKGRFCVVSSELVSGRCKQSAAKERLEGLKIARSRRGFRRRVSVRTGGLSNVVPLRL